MLLHCMDKPFKYIIDTGVYNLRWSGYGWRTNENKETIQDCITQTATYYDQTQVTPAQFKRMVDKITQGATNSPISQRKCVDTTVQAICIYYPGHLTATNVTSLIKCFDISNTTAVEYIESTGYKFTSSQYKSLNKAGIMMIDKMKSMSLPEFYSLFSNDAFKNKINTLWDVDPNQYAITVETDTKENVKEGDKSTKDGDDAEKSKGIEAKKIYPQYTYLKNIIDKYQIEVDSELWSYMIPLALTTQRYSKSYLSVKNILNLHRVVVGLGCKPEKSDLDNIIKNYEIKHSNFANNETDVWFDEILRHYTDISFNRSDIMSYVSTSNAFDNVKLVMRAKFCSYDPMMDLYYWMNGSAKDMKNYLLGRVIENRDQELYMHLVSIYHVAFSHFKTYIRENPDCGWDNEQFMRIMLSFNNVSEVFQYYVDNKLIVTTNYLDYIRDSSIIDCIYKSCTSYDEKGFNRMLELTHEKKSAIQRKSVASAYDRHKYRIFRSMSPRDRRIITHNSATHSYPLREITLILRYDIRITPEHLEYLLSSGEEEVVIRLLHTSRKYYYLIDLIDLDMALKCYNYLSRMWFYRNVVLPKTVDGLRNSEFDFCLYSDSEEYIFSVKMNDKEDADLPLDMEDRIEEIANDYREGIQNIQEAALDRILKN
jgi:hypothetical protein